MAWDSAAARWLRCPHCSRGLAPAAAGRALRCPDGHAFDVASTGYVNLLPSGRRLPKTVGDDRERLRARRRFLERGPYAPLSDALNCLAARHFADRHGRRHAGGPVPAVLDVGCGEGYYLGRLLGRLRVGAPAAGSRVPPVQGFGVDVAREAARLAVRRYPGAHVAVADATRGLPFRTGSVSVLLSVFAPRPAAELRRVVAPDGLLLVAVPTAAHLRELRAAMALLGIEPDKERRVLARLAGAFRPAGRAALEYPLALRSDEAADLVGMLPGPRRARAGAAGAPVGPLRTTVSVTLLTLAPV